MDDGRCTHAARDAEMNNRGWRGAGVEDVQVDGVLSWERKWRAGETERCYDNKG